MKTVYVNGIREMETIAKALKQMGYKFMGSAAGKELYATMEYRADGTNRVMIVNLKA